MIKSSNKPTIEQSQKYNVTIPIKDTKTNELKPLPTPKPYTENKEK